MKSIHNLIASLVSTTAVMTFSADAGIINYLNASGTFWDYNTQNPDGSFPEAQ